MAITGTGAAAALIASLSSSGKLDNLTTAQVNQLQIDIAAHYDVVFQYMIDNIEVVIPAGQVVVDGLDVVIGQTRDEQRGVIDE